MGSGLGCGAVESGYRVGAWPWGWAYAVAPVLWVRAGAVGPGLGLVVGLGPGCGTEGSSGELGYAVGLGLCCRARDLGLPTLPGLGVTVVWDCLWAQPSLTALAHPNLSPRHINVKPAVFNTAPHGEPLIYTVLKRHRPSLRKVPPWFLASCLLWGFYCLN